MTLQERRRGFSLAEVLITLGIIGVIAALTLPNLIHKYQDRVLTSRFKKGYSELSRAWSMVVAEDPYKYINSAGGWWSSDCGDLPGGVTNGGDERVIDLQAKMKVQKTCQNTVAGGIADCWSHSYESSGAVVAGYKFAWVTVDGICFQGTRNQWLGFDPAYVLMDTNCAEGPNRIGDDVFSMLLGVDGIVYFTTDSKDPEGAPVRSGLVCPYGEFTATIRGAANRTINFRDRLQK